MPGSTLSLESLSSPSPSPSPPPDRVAPKNSSHKSRSSNNAPHSMSLEKPPSGATGLDSDSELSELTEEEQDAADKRAAADDTPGAHSSRTGAARRGGHQRSSSRRGGRRKRSSIVPAPMWGWVETKTASVVEEEEEEELVQPPRAMEEEEDEDEDDEEGDLDGDDTLRRPRPTVKNGHKAQLNGRHRSSHPSGSDLKDIVDHIIVEGDAPVVNGIDNDDEVDDGASASGDDNSRPPSRAMAPTQIDRVRRSARTSLTKNGDEDQDIESGSDGDVDEDGPIKLPHNDEAEDSLSESELDVVPPEPESENETEDEEDDLKEPFSFTQAVMSPNKPKPVSPTALVHAINANLPAPQDIVNITAAAAASSIMAGSQVLNVPSPTSSASGSPSSSRSASPAPSGKGSDAGDADDDPPSTSKTKPNKAPAPDKDNVDLVEDDDATPTASSSHAKKAPPPLEIDVDMPDVDPENDPDRSVDDIEVDEPSPDDDLEVELESDLQPAHRAEALDVLATIELKFALLREKVYVEKMEGLAWEEELINQGNHPEMIHLHKELSKRRDKRLELASRKRSYEISNVAKRRRVDEDATWSWWKLARDDLQTDMIAETSRKRRRLERDRRAIERPQPIRRIPMPPAEALPPPSLRKIIKSAPFSNRHENKNHSTTKHYVYPELSTLSSADIASDLEFLYQNRRPPPYESHRNPTSVNTQMGPPVPHPYDHYEGMVNSFAGGNRMQPPVQAYPHHAPPLQHMSSFPPYGPGPGPSSGRIHHPQSSHHAHNHGQSQFPLDQEIGVITGPGQQLMPHHPYFGAQGSNVGNPFPGVHHTNGRRSISPVNVIPNSAGKQNGSWLGIGMGMGNFIGGSQNGGEWMGDGRRNEMAIHEDDDRERVLREREKREREQRDRESQEFDRDRQREQYHMQQLAQQHRQQAPLPPHVHSGPAVPAHRHHHRPHHHHVVHHHHGPGPGHASSSLPPAGGLLHSPAYDNHARPPPGPNHHQAEVLSLSSKPSTHWKDDQPQQHHDYRHRRPSIGALDDRERPLSFVMGSTQPVASPNAHHLNGAGTGPGNMPWNAPEDPYRSGPPNYLGAHEVPTHSPGHRYSNSGSGPPHLVGRVQQGGPGGNMGAGAMSPTRGRPVRSPPPSGFRSPVRYGGVPLGSAPPLSSSSNGQSIAPPYPSSSAPTPTTRSPVMRPVSPLLKASSSMTSKASPHLHSRFSPSLPSRMSPPSQSRLSPPLLSKLTSPVQSKVSSPVQSKHTSPVASKVASPVTSKRASPVASKISSPLPAKLVVPTAPRLSGPGGVGGMLDMAKNSVGLGPERGGYTSPPLTDRERERHISSPRLSNGLLPLPSKMQMVDGH